MFLYGKPHKKRQKQTELWYFNFQTHRALADLTMAADETNQLSRHFSRPGTLKSSAPKGESSNLGQKFYNAGCCIERLTMFTVLSISRCENVDALPFADTLGNRNAWQFFQNPCSWQGTAASYNRLDGPCEEGQSDITFRTFSFRTLGKTWDEKNMSWRKAHWCCF